MMKKAIAAFLASAMTLSFSPISYAASAGKVAAGHSPAGKPVSTADEFLAMEADGVYYLAADLDFSGKNYTQNVYPRPFKGVLDGNGHALLGITVNAENSDAGIFANGLAGQLSNLTVGSPDNPAVIRSTGAAFSVGGIAGTMAGGAKISNVCLYADIRGDGKTAGITSYLPEGSLTVEGCEITGSVTGNPASGFVAMSHDGAPVKVTITDCTNRAAVTGSDLGAGGIYAAHSNVVSSRLCDLTVRGCANFGAITASDWRAGGIVGEFHETKASKLDISYCYNAGSVTMTGGGGYAAGIAGGMAFDPPDGERSVRYCYNRGRVQNTAGASRAFELAFANSRSSNVRVTDCACTSGTSSLNVTESGITTAGSAKEMEEIATKYPAGTGGSSFIPDRAGTNGGYPVLARELSGHQNIVTYPCGRKVCADCGLILSGPEDEKHSNTEKITAPNGYTDGYITAECRYCHNVSVRPDKPCAYHLDPKDGVYTLTGPEHLLWYGSSLSLGLLTGMETLCVGTDLDFRDMAYTPVGSQAAPFTGTLLGGGHTISGITVKDQPDAGLIGVAGQGAVISGLALDGLSITGSGSAGALIGRISDGAVVKIANVSVTSSDVKSDGSSGGLVGSSDSAGELSVTNAVLDGLTVEGAAAGGVAGNGNFANLKNCYVHAALTGSKSSGTLAVHTLAFTQSGCYVCVDGRTAQNDGVKTEAGGFSSGAIAYQANTFGAVSVFGVKNGRTALSDRPMKRVRQGPAVSYTSESLSAGDSVAAYAAPAEGGMLLILVQKRNGPVRLVDSKITVDGREAAFADLTLTGYAKTGSGLATAQGDAVLYTLFLPGATAAPDVKIGDLPLGTAKNA